MNIRPAVADDLERINEIYNHYVSVSTCTYQDDPDTPEARAAWFEEREAKHPVLVAENDREIVGWGAISPFRPRSAYRNTGEVAVYVDHRFHRQGIGAGILKALMAHASTSGLHVLIASISAEQEPSLKLHESMGFRECGRLREVGHKFDTWLDVVYMQYLIPGNVCS